MFNSQTLRTIALKQVTDRALSEATRCTMSNSRAMPKGVNNLLFKWIKILRGNNPRPVATATNSTNELGIEGDWPNEMA